MGKLSEAEFTTIKQLLAKGYDGNNTPATKFDTNVALISGSSQSAFRFAFEGKTPLDLMHEVIDSERYQAIKA